jgi:hypothetical protein
MSPVKPKEEAAELANLQHISPRAVAAALRSESGSVLHGAVSPSGWSSLFPGQGGVYLFQFPSFLGSWGNTDEFGGCKSGSRGGGKFTFNSNNADNMAPAKPNGMEAFPVA